MFWLLWPIVTTLLILASIPMIFCRAWTYFPEDMDTRAARSVAKKLGFDTYSFSEPDDLRQEYVGWRLFWSILLFSLWPIAFPVAALILCIVWLIKFLAQSGKACAIRKAQKGSC